MRHTRAYLDAQHLAKQRTVNPLYPQWQILCKDPWGDWVDSRTWQLPWSGLEKLRQLYGWTKENVKFRVVRTEQDKYPLP